MLSYQRIFIVGCMVFFFCPALARAETRYISDQLVVSLREQPQNNAETIVYLKTDAPVEVLEAGEEYLKVKTENGEIGYIQKHYLTKDTPKASIISRLTRDNKALQQRVEELEKRLIKRGTDSPEQIQIRMARIPEEMELGKQFDYQIVNDDLSRAVEEVVRIVEENVYANKGVNTWD